VASDEEVAVTVLVAIDYGVDEDAAWADLRRCLTGVAAQDFDEPFEVVFLESAAYADRIPDDLALILPALRVQISDGTTAYDLMLDGAREARSELFATLDADSVPDPSWLRHLVAAMRARPDAAAICGRTTYGDRGLIVRLLAILQSSPRHPPAGAAGGLSIRRADLCDEQQRDLPTRAVSRLSADQRGRPVRHRAPR
jgi:hypothetical protein